MFFRLLNLLQINVLGRKKKSTFLHDTIGFIVAVIHNETTHFTIKKKNKNTNSDKPIKKLNSQMLKC